MPDARLSADAVIRLLELAPHPEGGFYRETFRDTRTLDGRACSTAILFLLRAGEVSRWHRVDAVEAWHWHMGAPLELSISEDGESVKTLMLGTDLAAGHTPQAIVPERAWQQARATSGWTLVGCTVAPGFEFSGFQMVDEGWEPGHGR